MNPFKIGFQDYKNLHNALKNLGVLVQNIVMWFPYYMSWAQDFMVTLRTFWTFKYREPFLKRKTKPDSLLGISFDKLWRFLTQMSNWLIDKFSVKCFTRISEPAEGLETDPHDNLIFD